MLVIRQAQMDALGESLKSRFESQLVRHFLSLYPRECKEAGGERQIAKLVSHGVRRAADLDYTNRQEAGLFVALTFILGDSFDADPQLPWAAAQLHDRAIRNPALRMARVYDSALDYLSATAGEDCGHLVRAMLRIRSYDLANVPDSSGEQWVDDFCGVLRRLYPQKFDYQGERANRGLIALGRENAERLRFHSNRSAAVFITLMFMLGSGFDRDLLYPWAQEAFTDSAQETELGDLLYRLAMAHLENSLSPD
jgi:hypothetical protein